MPVFLALVVLMNGIAAGIGPPLGGVLVESAMTWRLGFSLSIGEHFPESHADQVVSYSNELAKLWLSSRAVL